MIVYIHDKLFYYTDISSMSVTLDMGCPVSQKHLQ